ncbi:MAG: YdcF family protein [Pseudomonadota bacterium]
MILRLALVLGAFALLVQAATVVAVVIASSQMRMAHQEGASLAHPVDAAIILGGGIDPDGMLSYSSRRRVAAGVRLLADGKAELLILSGGRGPRNRNLSQGELMRRLALSYGAAPEQLIAEERAISTFQNLLFSYPIAEGAGATNLAIVTDPFHLYRASWLSALFGRGDTALIAADGQRYDHWLRRAYVHNREALAWWFNILKAAGWQGLGILGYSDAERMERIR